MTAHLYIRKTKVVGGKWNPKNVYSGVFFRLSVCLSKLAKATVQQMHFLEWSCPILWFFSSYDPTIVFALFGASLNYSTQNCYRLASSKQRKTSAPYFSIVKRRLHSSIMRTWAPVSHFAISINLDSTNFMRVQTSFAGTSVTQLCSQAITGTIGDTPASFVFLFLHYFFCIFIFSGKRP